MAKIKRNLGDSYISSSGVVCPSRKELQGGCGAKCRIGCTGKIDDNERKRILNEFWSISDLTCKREYIIRLIEQIIPKYQRKKVDSKRGFNYAYHFVVNGEKIKVCHKFFLKTLNISNMTVATAIRKFWRSSDDDGLVEGELRGKHKKSQKLHASSPHLIVSKIAHN